MSLDFIDFDISKPLTVLWFGGGQDSTALLLMAKYHEQFKAKYCQANFVVVMSDTGNEYPETYNHIANAAKFSRHNGIPFFFLKADMGFHTPSWQTLQTQMKRNNSIMSVVGTKSCTDSLKIQPCYKFLDWYVGEKYGFKTGYKRGIKAYEKQFGKINVIIGFAKGEDTRIATPADSDKPDKRPLWMQRTVQYNYPLIDYGMDRQDCQAYIEDKKEFVVPMPSNCMFCMFQSQQEVIFLERFFPKVFDKWVQFENNKIKRDESRGKDPKKNLGVKGNTRLPVFLQKAKEKYGNWTDEELMEYKFSHGHCAKSKY